MGMSIDDCAKILIAKEKCMSRETSGIDTDCNLHNCDNCDLCYEQGTMGEQKKALKLAVEIARKYQKIEQMVANNDNDGMIGRLVREVLEDGKID